MLFIVEEVGGSVLPLYSVKPFLFFMLFMVEVHAVSAK